MICLGYAPLMLWNVATNAGISAFLTDTNSYAATSGFTYETVATYKVIQEINDGSSFTFTGQIWVGAGGGQADCRLLLNDLYVLGTISAIGAGWSGDVSTTCTSAVWDRGTIKVQCRAHVGANSGVRNIRLTGEYSPFTM